MKTIYDLSFLTSPRDARQDSWIGQHFVLSYLNSERGTNFAFRYQPYEIAKGHLDHRPLFADRTNKAANDLVIQAKTNRTKKDMTFKGGEIHWGEWNKINKGISLRSFPLALKYQVAVIEWIRNLIKEHSYGHKYESILNTDRHIDRSGHSVQDLLFQFGYSSKDTDAFVEWAKIYTGRYEEFATIQGLLSHFQITISVPEAVLIGQLLIGHMKAYESGYTLDDLLHGHRNYHSEGSVSGYVKSDSVSKKTRIEELQLSDREYRRPVYLSRYANPDRPNKWDSVLVGLQPSDATDYIGIFYDGRIDTNRIDRRGTRYTNLLVETVHDNETYISELEIVDQNQAKEGSRDDLVLVELFKNKKVFVPDYITKTDRFESLSSIDRTEIYVDKQISRRIFVNQMQMIDKNVSKETRIKTDHIYVNSFPTEAFIPNESVYVENFLKEARISTDFILIHSTENEMRSPSELIFIEPVPISSFFSQETRFTEKIDSLSDPTDRLFFMSPTETVSDFYSDIKSMDRSIIRHSLQLDDLLYFDKELTPARIEESKITKTDSSPFAAQIDVINQDIQRVPKSASEYKEIDLRMLKIQREAWIQFALFTMTSIQKIAVIQQNWQSFLKHVEGAYRYNEQASNEVAEIAVKELKIASTTDNVEKTEKESKESIIARLLHADSTNLDGYILDMIGTERDQYWDEAIRAELEIAYNRTDEEQEGGRLEGTTAIVPNEEAIISRLIAAHDSFENTRQALIPPTTYVLVGDGSDWEDIWKRYTPGVDILDPPDSDFDYTTLASQVYDSQTGIPFQPIGATNLPDVKVKTPLHHPIPQHFDFGVDDTKELAVDNYVMIDVILAIESLKNRNSLRYAGMPAEKATRELFSKLFTWVQQAAHGNKEYDRMFRFSRWYAESITLKLSKHILHRVYNAWRSEYHLNGDLGIPYTQVNWPYFMPTQAAQTTSTHAELHFNKENYVDGEIIIRGYFDNPLGQGTMKVIIDGTVVDVFSANGAFTKTYEVPQGMHTYELVFDGASGRVMISTIEVTGCEFVSAHTTSDDSDTNGLKAATMLVSNLLAYYDKHHGDGKTKGTMQIKQRRVWNTQT